MNLYVVVLAGGAGTRFWPGGRQARPKQLLRIASEKSMLAETIERCSGLAPPSHCYIVTNEIQVEATRAECPQVPPGQIIAEPMMRNTAAAIGLAAVSIHQRDPEGVMAVMPADHVISPRDVFESTFAAAARRAHEAQTLLTVGISPTGPATGYGYIEAGDVVAEVEGHAIRHVESFKEKPDAAAAAAFIATGRYYWNSGTFVWSAAALLDAFERHLPGHHQVLGRIARGFARGDGILADDYARFENVPIDIGVMEKADNAEVIPGAFEWDDVGSWLAIDRLHERDAQGNAVRGDHIAIDTRNCIVFGTPDHLVATLGLQDMIVVHTPDATLICPKHRAEEVKRVVERLREEGREEHL